MREDLTDSNLAPALYGAEILLVSGPTCSGKTTLSRQLESTLKACVLHGDNWALSEPEVLSRIGELDFESPDAYEMDGLRNALLKLLECGTCECPVFDFAADAINGYQTITRGGGPVLVEFLHSFVVLPPDIPRAGITVKRIFVDCGAHLRFARRLKRDMSERGKSLDDVLRDWKMVTRSELRFLPEYSQMADVVVLTDCSSITLEAAFDAVCLSKEQRHKVQEALL